MNGALMRKALAGGNPVDQLIANCASPYQTVTFNKAIYDTGNYWNPVKNAFQIPPGVNFVRFVGQVVFLRNGNGLRQLLVQRSEPGSSFFDWFEGSPIHNTTAVAGTTTDIALSSAILPVREGECYALQPYQDSGTIVGISGGTGTFFGMEVIA